ncbi:hypothetical protein P9112_007878 [Eukaryota sp. TZLM1-RC]
MSSGKVFPRDRHVNSVKDQSIVRYTHGKSTFELITKPGSIANFRKPGSNVPLQNCITVEEVFTNATKGERAGDSELIETFGTADRWKVMEIISKEGEVQLTTAERRELVETKRRQMIQYLHKNYIDPKSKLPIPVTRFEQAFENIHLNIDPYTSAERQVQDKVLRTIVSMIPMKKSEIEGSISLPHAHLGKCLPIVHRYCNVRKENYGSSGAVFDVAIAPGDFDPLNRELSDASKGECSIDIAGGSVPTEEKPAAKSAGAQKSKKKK